jgi:hypothetical protein
VARVQDAQKKDQAQYNAAVNPPAPPKPAASAPQVTAVNIDPSAQSPSQRAAMRCITAGRSPMLCGENGLGKWFQGVLANSAALANTVAPGSADMLSKATKPLPPGLEIAGNYVGEGNWCLQFDDRSAMLSCGDLDPEQRFYSIGFVNNQAAIRIEMTPKPLTVYLRPDGSLAGEGPVVVNGRVVAGSQAVTTAGTTGRMVTTQTPSSRTLTPLEAQQYAGQSNLHQDGQYYRLDTTTTQSHFEPGKPPTTTYVPSYTPKTETCSVPNLKSAGKTQVDALKGLTESMLGGESASPTPQGLRMHGSYVPATGFSVEFFPESAIMGCGAAARAYPYSIQASAGQAVVRVSAADHPLNMMLRSDGSLDPGSGQYEVLGRRIIGQRADGDFVFAPLNQSCSLAVMKPGTDPAVSEATASPNRPGTQR